MADWPTQRSLPLTVHTLGMYGVGGATGRPVSTGMQLVSTAWGTANLAIYVPIWLPFRYPVWNLFVYNFATVAGNLDVGIYNEDGVKYVSSGSTAQAGASGLQFFSITGGIVLDPGQYFLAMSTNSTTATYACAVNGTAPHLRYLGLLQQTTAFALPATATFALMATLRVPLIGLTRVSGTPSF